MLNEGGWELQISPSGDKYVSVNGWNVKQETNNRNNRNNRDSYILCLVSHSLLSPRTSYYVITVITVIAIFCVWLVLVR